MSTVHCTVVEVTLEGDYCEVDGVSVTCGECGHEEEAYGTTDRSIRRCLATLRENCPRGEANFYITEDL